ncbi:MAG: hypothetical protein V4510_01795 [bacterium]
MTRTIPLALAVIAAVSLFVTAAAVRGPEGSPAPIATHAAPLPSVQEIAASMSEPPVRHMMKPFSHAPAVTLPVPTPPVAADALPSGGGNLVYHGGPVQTAPKVYLVYWGWNGVDPANVEPYLTAFFNGVGGTGWANIQTQYSSITNPTGQLAGVWHDNSALPPTIPDLWLPAEAIRAEAYFGYSADADYIIATPPYSSTAGFGAEFCAWHSTTTDSLSRNVAFTNLPYMPTMPETCGAYSVNGGLPYPGLLDGVSIVAGHEYAEVVTDPVPVTGWADSTGGAGENADKCAWVTSGPGHMQNVAWSTGTFAVQGLWSNAASGCVITYP